MKAKLLAFALMFIVLSGACQVTYEIDDASNKPLIGNRSVGLRFKKPGGFPATARLRSLQLKFNNISRINDELQGIINIPLEKSYIKKHTVDVVDTTTDRRLETFHFAIGGQKPFIQEISGTPSELFTVDTREHTYKAIGHNILSIDKVESEVANIKIENLPITNNDSEFEFKVTLSPGVQVQANIPMKVYYKTIDNNGQLLESSFIHHLPIEVRVANTGTVIVSPDLYEDDIEGDQLNVDLKLTSNFAAGQKVYVIEADMLKFKNDPMQITFADDKTCKASLPVIASSIEPGIQNIALYYKNTGGGKVKAFTGKFTIIKAPVITRVSNELNGTVTLSNTSRRIIIEGEGLQDVSIAHENSADKSAISFANISTPQKNTKGFEATLHPDQIDYGKKYKVHLQRKTGKVYYTFEIVVAEPCQPYQFDANFISLKSGNDDFTSSKTINLAKVDDLSIRFNCNSIPKAFGHQAYEGTVRILDEMGEVVYTYQIESDLVVEPRKIYVYNAKLRAGHDDKEIPLNLKRIKNKIPPYGTIEITLMHAPDFYQPETARERASKTYTLKVIGRKSDNVKVAVTIPPFLLSVGYDNNFEAQALPLNIGFGIIRQFRNSEYELQPIDLGVYVAGLNILGRNSEGNSDGETDDRFVNSRDIALLGIVQLHPWGLNINRRIPIQLGFGYSIPQGNTGNKGFMLLGISYNLFAN